MKSWNWHLLPLAVISFVWYSFEKGEAPNPTEKANTGFAVVELFTSEGCSSCPPAERLFNSIVKDAEANGKEVFALAFHVDYWNRLGWKDRFSEGAYSERQRIYAQKLKARSVYTPQMVVNGNVEFVGSSETEANRAITQALVKAEPVQVTLKMESQAGATTNVSYEVSEGAGAAVINFALVEKGLFTVVQRGENSGRKLHHDNVVRLFKTETLTESGTGVFSITLPEGVDPSKAEIIAFVQQKESYQILGADRLNWFN